MAPLFLRDNVKTDFNQMNNNLNQTSIQNALSGPAACQIFGYKFMHRKPRKKTVSILVQFKSLLAIISVNDFAKKYKKCTHYIVPNHRRCLKFVHP